MRSDREKLLDISEAIERIEQYSSQGRGLFECDQLVQVWMVHHLQVIGEAASQISEQTQSRYPDIPWRKIVAMRNLVVHAYYKVDLDEVWGAVERDIPALKAQVAAILDSEDE